MPEAEIGVSFLIGPSDGASNEAQTVCIPNAATHVSINAKGGGGAGSGFARYAEAGVVSGSSGGGSGGVGGITSASSAFGNFSQGVYGAAGGGYAGAFDGDTPLIIAGSVEITFYTETQGGGAS